MSKADTKKAALKKANEATGSKANTKEKTGKEKTEKSKVLKEKTGKQKAEKGRNILEKINKTDVKKCLVIIFGALIISLLAEVFFNLNVIKLNSSEKGLFTFSLENDVTFDKGFSLVNGKLVLTGKGGTVRLNTPDMYVNKMVYTYNYGGDTLVNVRVSQGDSAKPEESFINITDGNNRAISVSEVKVKNHASCIELQFTEKVKGLEIVSMQYDNRVNFSGRRMLVIGTMFGVFIFLYLYNDLISKKLEYGFLVVATATCIAMIFSFPAQKVSWDEAYHFGRAYDIGFGGDRVTTPELKYFESDDAVSSLLYPVSEKEFDQLEEYMDQSNIYDKNDPDNFIKKAKYIKLNDIGHFASSVGISIGRLFKLPLSTLYYMGKLFNALFYIIVTFFAIRYARVGKRLLTGIALMPTTLYLASVYSYDAMLNACAFLALSYIITEIVEKDKKMEWKSYIIFVVAVGIASAIKMVYAPIMLLLLLLPKEKFDKKSTKFLMKYGVFVLCILLVGIMIVPILIHPPSTGDLRGGTTSYSGQLSNIFSNPVKYAKILFWAIGYYGIEYSVGNSIFGTFAHYTFLPFAGYTTLFILFLAFTDTRNARFKATTKLMMGIDVMIIVCFVWTAMYISFTPVGAVSINGVQGRYFIPVVYPLLLLFGSNRIDNKMSDKVYNVITLVVPMLLTYLLVAYKAIAYII